MLGCSEFHCTPFQIGTVISVPAPSLSPGTAPANFFRAGAKKMDLPLVLFPVESSGLPLQSPSLYAHRSLYILYLITLLF